MRKLSFLLRLKFLVLLCNFEGFGNELRIEGNKNGDEILILSSNIVGTVSANSAIFGAALVFFAISLTVLYFLLQELFNKQHDDYEVLKVIRFYQLYDDRFGLVDNFTYNLWEPRNQLFLIR